MLHSNSLHCELLINREDIMKIKKVCKWILIAFLAAILCGKHLVFMGK